MALADNFVMGARGPSDVDCGKNDGLKWRKAVVHHLLVHINALYALFLHVWDFLHRILGFVRRN
jgi:hypothetical protein